MPVLYEPFHIIVLSFLDNTWILPGNAIEN